MQKPESPKLQDCNLPFKILTRHIVLVPIDSTLSYAVCRTKHTNKRKHTYTTTNNLHDKVECCKKHQKTFREKLFKFHPSLYTNYVFNLTFKPPNLTIMFSTTSWQKNKNHSQPYI